MGRKEQDEEISRLYQIIENELQKPEDEMDSSLIAECSDFIEEIRQEQGEQQSIDYDQTLESIYAKIEGLNAGQPANVPQVAKRLRFPRRKRMVIRLSVAMIAILVLMMSITVVAVHNGYSSAWEYIAANIKEIMDMSGGESENTGNITMIINNHGTHYSSIEELLEQEQLDIMYPSVLPENVKLQKVTQYDSEENGIAWDFQTSDDKLGFTVYNSYRTPLDAIGNVVEYQTEQLNFVIIQMNDQTYHAIAQQNGYEYIIRYDNYNELLRIIKGMKGIEK